LLALGLALDPRPPAEGRSHHGYPYLAASTGPEFIPAPDAGFAAIGERRHNVLADVIDPHLDTSSMLGLIVGGVQAGLQTLVSPLAVP
jgi:hypothetical protein